jgi:peptidoglycan/xylan/chitin deacetylase (PgdA/CDA1 family)
MFYLVKSPWLLQKYFSECTWKINTDQNELYLTFDDGPNPMVTSFVLDELKKYNAKATFFCLGKNVEQYFDIYKKILNDGHQVGNHTFSHLNGWNTKDKIYVDDIAKAARIIDSNLFRPPYGRITKFQLRLLKKSALQLKPVMWDVLSGDFDASLKPENCYLNVIKNAERGSIIVFHDSAKAFSNLQYALPRVLSFYSEKGFVFRPLQENLL